MNYLGRQIFPFAINWADAVERSVDYDLRARLLGFGAEYFTPTATYTVNGWAFGLTLETGADMLAFETFCDILIGRLNGFWLPCPLRAAVIAAGISASQFKIATEGLADTWNQRPDQHLLFTFSDGTQAAGQILGVVDNGDGTETVTLTAALPEAPAPGNDLQRLHYVRFGGDEESYDYPAENVALIKLAVVELPLEYAAAETGLQPIYLYHFWMKAPVGVDWYYTSFGAPVVSAGILYNPWPTEHGAIRQTTDGQSNGVDITSQPDDTHPFAMLVDMPPGQVLWCRISRVWLSMPDAAKNLFTGFVKTVDDNTTEFVAHCFDRLDWLRSKAPLFYIGTVCNYDLFDQSTCKIGRAFFETTVTISAIPAGELPVLQCTFNFSFQLANWQKEDWFKGGSCEANVGIKYDLRSIVHSHWNAGAGVLELTLNAPLRAVNGVNTQLQITAGCDHTSDGPHGCTLKFNNFPNFGACVDVPDRNLTLKGLNTNVSQGGKKA